MAEPEKDTPEWTTKDRQRIYNQRIGGNSLAIFCTLLADDPEVEGLDAADMIARATQLGKEFTRQVAKL